VRRLEETLDALRELAPHVPLLVGGASEAVIDLAARKADSWNVPATHLDALPALAERLRQRAAAAGRRVEVVARLGQGRYGFAAGPEETARQIEHCRALGIERFVLRLHPDSEAVLERYRRELTRRVGDRT